MSFTVSQSGAISGTIPGFDGTPNFNKLVSFSGTNDTGVSHIFIGNIEFGKRNGFGCLILSNGQYHMGQYSDDKMHGFGIYYFAEKMFIGQFINGEFDKTNGVYVHNTGDVYINGVLVPKEESALSFNHGNGITSNYWGSVLNDQQHGYGQTNYSTGDKYYGTHENNRSVGYGIYTWTDGEKHIGKFHNDLPCGIGLRIYPNGKVYIGEHKDGLAHGIGAFYYADGTAYWGNTANGKGNGVGIYLNKDGKKEESIWENNNRVKRKLTREELNIVAQIRIPERYAPALPRKEFEKSDAKKYKGSAHIEIPHGYTEIYYAAFNNNKTIQSITIPSSVNKIGDYAFSGCQSLKEILIPSGVRRIGEYAFKNCSNLTSVIFQGNALESIESYAFQGCKNLANINIPNSITHIGKEIFIGCENLKKVVIPKHMNRIPDGMFAKCSSLEEIDLSNIEQIGEWSFSKCVNLKSVNLENAEKIGAWAFNGCVNLSYIGNVSFDMYQEQRDGVVIYDSPVHIHAFSGCKLLPFNKSRESKWVTKK
jgi:hypothetical protein